MKKGKILAALSILVIFITGALIGYRYYYSDSQIVNRAMNAQLPNVCSICDFKGKHAPCIVNLSTGEIGELKVYNTSPENERIISTQWDGGTFSFVHVLGLHSWRDSWTQSNHCDVPVEGNLINGEHFCIDCRKVLLETSLRGYIIVDCFKDDTIVAYPIIEGEKYSIRKYDVTVTTKESTQDEYEVVTTGHYMDGMIPK